MKPSFFRIAFFSAALFFACGTALAQKPVVKKPVTKKPIALQNPVAGAAVNNAKDYPNGIKLNVKGFIVKEAYLAFDDESKVPADNMVALNQRVSLRIILSTGFKETAGKVFPGGTEKIELSTGEVILNSEDLFTAYDSVGVSPADAKYVTLKAVLSEIKDKTNAVIVSFKVWDKKSDANEITGSYKMYIK